MTEPDTSYIAKVVVNAYDSETNKYSALSGDNLARLCQIKNQTVTIK